MLFMSFKCISDNYCLCLPYRQYETFRNSENSEIKIWNSLECSTPF